MDWSENNTSEQASLPQEFTFLDFLAIAQRSKLDFLPVSIHRGLDLLGAGSTSEVYQSIINTENAFAFKQKSEHASNKNSELLHGLCVETLILCHPQIQEDCNIIDILGITWQDDVECGTVWPTLVFPKAGFGSLQEFLDHTPGLEISIDEKLRLCSSIINAIQNLHACNIVHGDLKPENVLIFEGIATKYSAKLADLGWSRFEHVPGDKVKIPRSWPWCAPEWHHREVSFEYAKRMDIFSLGMLCLWVILQHIIKEASGIPCCGETDPWLRLFLQGNSSIDLLVEWKNRKSLDDLATHALEHLPNVTSQDKSALLVFFRRSLRDSYVERESDILRLVKDLGGHGFPALSKPTECLSISIPEHNTFQLADAIPQLSLMNYHVRLSIVDALDSTLYPSKQAANVHCKDICAKSNSFQLALAYKIGFCGLQNESKLEKYLQDSSFGHEHLDDVLERLRTDQLSLNYSAKFQNLLLDGFIHLTDLTEQSRYSRIDGSFDEKCVQEVRAAETILGGANSITVILKQTLASVYKSKSRFQTAACLEKENVDAILGFHGVNNPMIPKLLLRLGSTYCQIERQEEALELQRKAVKLVNASHKDGHPIAMNASATLASTLWRCGKWEEAEGLFQELLQRSESFLDTQHPEPIALRANLAMAKKKLGKLEAAESLQREAVDLCLKTLGPDSIVAWITSANLSRNYIEQGRFDEAEGVLKSLQGIQKERISEDHPEKLRALNVLADSYRHRKCFKDALQILSKTVSIQRKLQGENHPDTIRTHLLIAQCYHSKGDSGEAVSLLKDLLTKYFRDYTLANSNDASWTAEALTEIASQFKQQGLLTDAGELEERIVMDRRETIGLSHPATIVATAFLCETLALLNDFEKEDKYEASLSIELLKKLEGDSLVAVRTLADLGSAYIDKDELDRAQRVLEKAWKAAMHILGADDMVTLSSLCNLASVYALKGMPDEAFDAYLKAIKAKLRILGEATTSTQVTMTNFKYFCDCIGLDWETAARGNASTKDNPKWTQWSIGTFDKPFLHGV